MKCSHLFLIFAAFIPKMIQGDLLNQISEDHSLIGIYVVDTATNKVVLEKNSQLSLLPASCMKAVTTAAALQILDPNDRFETHLEYDGFIDANKTLKGNIYIRGGGDPCLGSDRFSGPLSWKKQIDAWADAVEQLGIQKIEGKIIGDSSKWEKALAVPSWTWEDLGNYYGAGASALSFHENSYALFFKPGEKEGDRATFLRTEPPLAIQNFQNEVTTGPKGSGDRACIYGSEFSPLQFARGTIPLGLSEFSIKGAVSDPAEYSAKLLAEELQKRAKCVLQQQLSPSSPRTSFHITLSPTIREIVYWTNQKSINLYAEHLLKKMGEIVYKDGSTNKGVKAVTQFWRSQNIDLNGFHMVDGSGLSRKNLATPKQLVEILLKIKDSKIFPLFLESLPEIQGSLKAKSGSMSFVKGYVGYSRNTAFAILVNHCFDPKLLQKKLDHFFSYLENLSDFSKDSENELKLKDRDLTDF